MSTKLILVTGATGATGGYALRHLLNRGVRLRALVHSDDERAAALRADGIETVMGDLLEFDTVRAALQDVDAAYFVYPIRPRLLDATAYFAEAAREAGVQAIVNMSQISARRDAVSHAAHDHWFAEQVLDWSGVPTTHLRPTFFMEWFLYAFQRPLIAEHDTLRVPAGEGSHAPIAAIDQGRVIAEILLNPQRHAGKVYPLFGATEMSHRQIAEVLSQVLGRTIAYDAESLQDFAARLSHTSLPEYFIQHICAVYKDYQRGAFAGNNHTVSSITGHEPTTIEDFVRAHRAAFEPEDK